MRRGTSLRARVGRAVPYAVLLCGAAYLYMNAGQFTQLAKPGELGPGFWPRAILGLLMLVCVGAIAGSLAFPPSAGRATESAAQAPEDASEVPSTEPSTHPYLLLAGIALSAAYVASLEWLGFFLATALYLGLFMWLGRYRRTGIIVVTSLVGSLAFVFVFMKIVYVSLPLGAGPFQALSIVILAALGVH